MKRRRASLLLVMPALVIPLLLMKGSKAGSCGCPMPTGPSYLAGNYQTYQVTLTWDDNSNNEGGFHVERLNAYGTWESVCSTGPNVTSCIDNNVYGCYCYVSYKVNAFDACGYISYHGCPATPAYTSVYWY